MWKQLSLIVMASFLGAPTQAAPPLVPGDIVIAGLTYFGGYPAGACSDRLCRVDPLTGAVTPLTDPIPDIRSVEIESATSVLALRFVFGPAWTWDLLRVDLTSGAVATIATGIDASTFSDSQRVELTVTPDGGRYLLTPAGIVSVGASGVVTTLAPGEWYGLDVEATGALISMRIVGVDPYVGQPVFEPVRIDPATGAITPLPITSFGAWCFEAAASGGWFGFTAQSLAGPGYIWGPNGTLISHPGFRGTLQDLAAGPDGELLAFNYVHPENSDPIQELYRIASDGSQQTFDYDFGIVGGDVMRRPRCSDGADNDGDGAADLADVGCANVASDDESPRCDDGIDNDGDGTVDWDGGDTGLPPDAHCTVASLDREGGGGGGCGVGAELVVLLTGLAFATRRARKGMA